MKNRIRFLLVSSLILILASCTGTNGENSTAPVSDTGGATQQVSDAAEIDAASLYSSNCARCHGADRTGGAGPALLPDRLTKGQEVYVKIITDGSGPMPAWGSRLSADEINALVDFILSSP